MANSNAVALAQQDLVFYDQSFPKEHVHFLLQGLKQIQIDHAAWEWPMKKWWPVDQMINKLYNEFGVLYHRPDVVRVVKLLHNRHTVYTMMRSYADLEWEPTTNRFIAHDGVWEKLMAKDKRVLWYVAVGDPLWCDLGILFEGIGFGYAPDSFANAAANSVEPTPTYELEEPNSPVSPLNEVDSRALTVVHDASPVSQHPLLFASGNTNSPGYSFITSAEWEKSRLLTDEKKAARKKIIWDFSGSPGESSGSSPAQQISAGTWNRNVLKKKIAKESRIRQIPTSSDQDNEEDNSEE